MFLATKKSIQRGRGDEQGIFQFRPTRSSFLVALIRLEIIRHLAYHFSPFLLSGTNFDIEAITKPEGVKSPLPASSRKVKFIPVEIIAPRIPDIYDESESSRERGKWLPLLGLRNNPLFMCFFLTLASIRALSSALDVRPRIASSPRRWLCHHQIFSSSSPFRL